MLNLNLDKLRKYSFIVFVIIIIIFTGSYYLKPNKIIKMNRNNSENNKNNKLLYEGL